MSPPGDKKNPESISADNIDQQKESQKESPRSASDFLDSLAQDLKNISPERFATWTNKLPSVLSSFVIPEYSPEKDIEQNSEVLKAVQSFTPILIAKLLLVETDPEVKKQIEAGNFLSVIDKINPNNLTDKEQKIIAIIKEIQKKPDSPAAEFLREKMLPKIIGDALKIKQEGEDIAKAVKNSDQETGWDKAAKFIKENPALVTTGLVIGAGAIAYAAYQFSSDNSPSKNSGEQTSNLDKLDPIAAAKEQILGGYKSNLLSLGLLGGLSIGGFYMAGKILDTKEIRLMLKDGTFDPDKNRLTQSMIHFSNLRLIDGLYTLANGADKEQEFHETKAKELHAEPFVIRLMGEKKLGTLISNQDSVLPKYAVESFSWPPIPQEYFEQEKKLRDHLRNLSPQPENLDITYSEYLRSYSFNIDQKPTKDVEPTTANPEVNEARQEEKDKREHQRSKRLELKNKVETGNLTAEDFEYLKNRSSKLREEFDALISSSPGYLDKALIKWEMVLPEYLTRDKNEQDAKYYEELNQKLKELYKKQGLELDNQIQSKLNQDFELISQMLQIEGVGETSLTPIQQKTIEDGFEAFSRLERNLTEIHSNTTNFEEQQRDLNDLRDSESLEDTTEVLDAIGFTTIWGIPMQAYIEADKENYLTASIYAVPTGVGTYLAAKQGIQSFKAGGGISRVALSTASGFVKGQFFGAYQMVKVPLQLSKQATETLAPKLFPRFSTNPGLDFVNGKMNLDDLNKHINGQYRLREAYNPNLEIQINPSTKATINEIKQALDGTHTNPERAKLIRDAILERRFREAVGKGRLVRYSYQNKTALMFLDEIKNNEKLANFFIENSKTANKLLTPYHRSLSYLDEFLAVHKQHGDKLLELLAENPKLKDSITSRNRNALLLLKETPTEALGELKNIENPKTVAQLVKVNGKNYLLSFDQLDEILRGQSQLDEAIQNQAVRSYFNKILGLRENKLSKLTLSNGTKLTTALATIPEQTEFSRLMLNNPDLFDGLTTKKGIPRLELLLKKIKEAQSANRATEFLTELNKQKELLNALRLNDPYAIKFLEEFKPGSQIGIKAEFHLLNPNNLRESLGARIGGKLKDLMSVFPKDSDEFKALLKIQTSPETLARFNKAKAFITAKNWPRIVKASKYISKGAGVGLPALGAILSGYQAHEAWKQSNTVSGPNLADNLAIYRTTEGALEVAGLIAPALLVKAGVFATYGEALAASGPVALAVAPVAITFGYMMEQTSEASIRWKTTSEQWKKSLEQNPSNFFNELTKLSKDDINFTDNVLGFFDESLEENVEVSNVNARRKMWEAMAEKYTPQHAQLNVINYIKARTNGKFKFDPFTSGNIFREALNYAYILDAAKTQKELNAENPNKKQEYITINGEQVPLKDIQPFNADSYLNQNHEDQEIFANMNKLIIDVRKHSITESVAHEIAYNENQDYKALATIAVSQYSLTANMFLGSLVALLDDNFDSDDFTPNVKQELYKKYITKLQQISESKLKDIPPTAENIPKITKALLDAQDSFNMLNRSLFNRFKSEADDTWGDINFEIYQKVIKEKLES